MIRVTVIDLDANEQTADAVTAPVGHMGSFVLESLPRPGDHLRIGSRSTIVNLIEHVLSDGRQEISVFVSGSVPPHHWFRLEWSPDVEQPQIALGIQVRHDTIPRIGERIVVETCWDGADRYHLLGPVEVVGVLHYIVSAEAIEFGYEEALHADQLQWRQSASSSSAAIRVLVRPAGDAQEDALQVETR